MRVLLKLDAPEVLILNGSAWTAEYVDAQQNGQHHPGYWGHPEIRETLRVEVRGKCAYCEAFIGHVAYEHVEHIKPKSLFPELAHHWPNLTSACPRCNVNKGDYYVANMCLLDPYDDEPQEHVEFCGGLIIPIEGSERGEFTIRRLQLDRYDLTAVRERRLKAVLEMVLKWRAAEEPLKGVLAGAILLDLEEGEYTAAVRAFLRAVGFDPVSE